MDSEKRSRFATRAAILASTAIIALLSACQAPAGNTTPSSTAPSAAKGGEKIDGGGGGY
jgi:hypothetical protein